MQTVKNLRSLPQFRVEAKSGVKSLATIGLVLAVFLIPSASYANAIIDINETVRQFLLKSTTTTNNGQIEIKVARVDSRLNLKKCATPLQAFLLNTRQLRGKVTVGIRCESTKPWSLYVSAEILIFEHIIVSLRPLQRGHIIGPNDITRNRVKTSDRNTTYFTDPKHVIGKMLTQHLGSGKIISARILQARRLVRRGQTVTLIAISHDLQVRASGKALDDGAKGDVIKVQNLKSKRIIEGIVMKTGIVQVIM